MTTLGNPVIILSSFFCLFLLFVLFRFLHRLWWTPFYIQYLLASQGIKGPSYKFIHGNTQDILKMRNEALSKPMALSHDIFSWVQPQAYSGINKYETELIKEVLNNRDRAYPKVGLPFYVMKLMGDGLATSEGEKWANHRKLLNYVFQGESLKNMIPEMIVLKTRCWKQENITKGKRLRCSKNLGY
ncbi:Cytochrome P450, putative [Theobroma cacao]|uniref:Cytochrome P450, putative n=1 Tax=Theobroma cacao TaxID=3641 RepID=A0A061EB33_THECC|nr:Cytochrome P450, putative [Theobroma cacao]